MKISDIVSVTIALISEENDDEFRERMKSNPEANSEVDSHEGQIYNPYTGEWSWL